MDSETREVLEVYAQFPIEYFALCQEAERRGLIMRNTEIENPIKEKSLVKR